MTWLDKNSSQPYKKSHDKKLKEIPLVFPITLILIIATLIFSSAYAIADGATGVTAENQTKLEWHENAAVWVCPFH